MSIRKECDSNAPNILPLPHLSLCHTQVQAWNQYPMSQGSPARMGKADSCSWLSVCQRNVGRQCAGPQAAVTRKAQNSRNRTFSSLPVDQSSGSGSSQLDFHVRHVVCISWGTSTRENWGEEDTCAGLQPVVVTVT